MLALRSLVFNVAFFILTSVLLLACLPLIVVHRHAILAVGRFWARAVMALLRVLVGVRWEARGNLAPLTAPCLVAAKHQSAWDTIIFYLLAADPAYVMKRELMAIPVYGWLSRKQRMIAIDRRGGAAALRRLVEAAEAALAEGRQIVIFPQGTRVAPGAAHPYQPGIAALYRRLNAPVVPIALNSGLCWGKRSFLKHPGLIVIEALTPIAPGLKREAFMAELEAAIETASDRLIAGKPS
jgi:1-acyl-sn-glycerol-3-phosphate acyltransferase